MLAVQCMYSALLYVVTLYTETMITTDLSLNIHMSRPAKLHAFGVKAPHFTCTSHTNFPNIFYKFTHFCFSGSPYISSELLQLQLGFMHFA